MNRRDLLKRLGAAGLMAATVDGPRFWSLDRTMIPGDGFRMWGDFDTWYTAQVSTSRFEWVIHTAEISAAEPERPFRAENLSQAMETWESIERSGCRPPVARIDRVGTVETLKEPWAREFMEWVMEHPWVQTGS